ncbi:MAG: cytochrome c [Alphaproteobacteria bacterium]|nr:cytochrome c [Alphaproteobacteria bacterium]MCB9930078.1 cytochrome c [Alphaproteobacteria bacterium]
MTRTLIAAALAVCVAGPALADADAAIKYRQNAMKAIGSQMGSIVAILKGEIDNKAALAKHAAIMGEATSTAITIPAFKTNTDGQGDIKTTATADVWGEWDKFEEGLRKLEQAGKDIAMAGADASMDNVKALGSACKACHDHFRQK